MRAMPITAHKSEVVHDSWMRSLDKNLDLVFSLSAYSQLVAIFMMNQLRWRAKTSDRANACSIIASGNKFETTSHATLWFYYAYLVAYTEPVCSRHPLRGEDPGCSLQSWYAQTLPSLPFLHTVCGHSACKPTLGFNHSILFWRLNLSFDTLLIQHVVWLPWLRMFSLFFCCL